VNGLDASIFAPNAPEAGPPGVSPRPASSAVQLKNRLSARWMNAVAAPVALFRPAAQPSKTQLTTVCGAAVGRAVQRTPSAPGLENEQESM
jgi:hypothetical protein